MKADSGKPKAVMTFRSLLIYGLLIVGSLVFVWPFLWMATTSAKLDRELFGETMRLLPQRPIPRLHSPYVDDRLYEDLSGPRMKEALALIEQDLTLVDYLWPDGVDRVSLIQQTARGIYSKLLRILPGESWTAPVEELRAKIRPQISPALIGEVVAQLRRTVCLGSLRAQSYEQEEDLLVPAERAATTWQLGGNARAQLIPAGTPNEPCAELEYDFSKGDTITLTQSFKTTFPLSRLHRLLLSIRYDDTWHGLRLVVVKDGRRMRRPAVCRSRIMNGWSIPGRNTDRMIARPRSRHGPCSSRMELQPRLDLTK